MRIGIVDTMFAKADMGALAEQTLIEHANGNEIQISRYTVPGIKDLAVGAKKLMVEHDCDIIIALGMVGKEKIDETCAHEANIALMNVEIEEIKHILKVFIHEQEAIGNEKKLAAIMKDRTIKHSLNALDLLFYPQSLIERAGTGQRQGSKNTSHFKLEETS